MRVDVAIAGDGPAGLAAAIVLARGGARVAVIGRPRFAAHRPGETLPGAGLRLLRMLGLPSLAQSGPHRPLTGLSSAWDTPRLVERDHFASPDGAAWLIDRDAFDRDLASAAIEVGARIVIGAARPEMAGTRWIIPAGDTEVEAGFLVDATGRGGRIARRLGPAGEAQVPATAWWAVCEGKAPARLWRPMIERTSDGWWFAVSLDASRTYAAFHTDRALAPPARRAEAWRARLRSTRWVAEAVRGAGEWGRVRGCPAGGVRLGTPWGPNWAACGDAAMALDPLSSQGLLSAMAGGHELAKALSATGASREAALRAYGERLDTIWSIYADRRAALLCAGISKAA